MLTFSTFLETDMSKSKKGCLHFVGFKGDEFHRAQKVFGKTDFIHRIWDGRAKSMILPCDKAVFAKGTNKDKPNLYSHDDSQHF